MLVQAGIFPRFSRPGRFQLFGQYRPAGPRIGLLFHPLQGLLYVCLFAELADEEGLEARVAVPDRPGGHVFARRHCPGCQRGYDHGR